MEVHFIYFTELLMWDFFKPHTETKWKQYEKDMISTKNFKLMF